MRGPPDTAPGNRRWARPLPPAVAPYQLLGRHEVGDHTDAVVWRRRRVAYDVTLGHGGSFELIMYVPRGRFIIESVTDAASDTFSAGLHGRKQHHVVGLHEATCAQEPRQEPRPDDAVVQGPEAADHEPARRRRSGIGDDLVLVTRLHKPRLNAPDPQEPKELVTVDERAWSTMLAQPDRDGRLPRTRRTRHDGQLTVHHAKFAECVVPSRMRIQKQRLPGPRGRVPYRRLVPTITICNDDGGRATEPALIRWLSTSVCARSRTREPGRAIPTAAISNSRPRAHPQLYEPGWLAKRLRERRSSRQIASEVGCSTTAVRAAIRSLALTARRGYADRRYPKLHDDA
jgi:hypothetical protein